MAKDLEVPLPLVPRTPHPAPGNQPHGVLAHDSELGVGHLSKGPQVQANLGDMPVGDRRTQKGQQDNAIDQSPYRGPTNR